MTDLVLANGGDVDAGMDERIAWELVQRAETMLFEPPDARTAEALLRRVRAAEEAMRLARVSSAAVVAMGRVRLRAWARWGELLGPTQPGRPRGVVPGSTPNTQRTAMSRARKLARAKELDPEAFEAYVSREHDESSLAGVMRAIKASTRASEIRVPPSTTPYSNKRGRAESVILVAFHVKRATDDTRIELLETLNEEWEGRTLSSNARVIEVDLV